MKMLSIASAACVLMHVGPAQALTYVGTVDPGESFYQYVMLPPPENDDPLWGYVVSLTFNYDVASTMSFDYHYYYNIYSRDGQYLGGNDYWIGTTVNHSEARYFEAFVLPRGETILNNDNTIRYNSYAFPRLYFAFSADERPLDWTLDISATGGVPEPATWAMLIAGFGLMGTMIRKSRYAGLIVSDIGTSID